jgi:macrodomain Ter protein organizer (MatP/YcbG family)
MVHVDLEDEVWKKLKAYITAVEMAEDEQLTRSEAVDRLIDNSEYSDQVDALKDGIQSGTS